MQSFYFERLRNCNVIEVANTDWLWMKQVMEDYTLAGKLKRSVSRQASILELTHGAQSGFSNTKFLKGLRMQMSYNHHFRMSDMAGVLLLEYPIRVEVDQEYEAPFKKTNLRQELMCMRHPPALDGFKGATFIDGVHYVHTGPGRGHICLLYKNTDINEAYIDQIQMSLASHVHKYLCKVSHYLDRCCQKILTSWFHVDEALQAPDARWDSMKYTATTLCSLSNRTYDRDMELLGMVDMLQNYLLKCGADQHRSSNLTPRQCRGLQSICNSGQQTGQTFPQWIQVHPRSRRPHVLQMARNRSVL
jgi:hypothetical protein